MQKMSVYTKYYSCKWCQNYGLSLAFDLCGMLMFQQEYPWMVILYIILTHMCTRLHQLWTRYFESSCFLANIKNARTVDLHFQWVPISFTSHGASGEHSSSLLPLGLQVNTHCLNSTWYSRWTPIYFALLGASGEHPSILLHLGLQVNTHLFCLLSLVHLNQSLLHPNQNSVGLTNNDGISYHEQQNNLF